MSDHYDFRLACDLRADLPQQVLDTLRYMAREGEYHFDNPPPPHVFEAYELSHNGELYEDWRHLYQCHEGYTPGSFGSSLTMAHRGERGGQQIVLPTLDVHCYVLDDELASYLEFCDWLAPYCETRGFIGYLHNELTDDLLLLYIHEGRLSLREIGPYTGD